MQGRILETHQVPEVVGALTYDNRPAGDLAPGYGMLLEVEGDDLNVNSRRNSLHAARDVNPEIP